MIESWLLEIATGIGKLFLNPILYWSVALVLIAGYKRIRKDRQNFGLKFFDVFAEWKGTWLPSLVAGIILSAIIIGFGIIFTHETIWVFVVVTIIVSLSFRFSLLSPSYTLGITYLLLLFLPFLTKSQQIIDYTFISDTNFAGLALLMGMLLIVEAVLMQRIKRNETFPDLELGRRGQWEGLHHIKKLSIVPFFVVLPTGAITPFAAYWPSFGWQGESYSLVLIPFLIGFQFKVAASLPAKAANRLGLAVHALSVVVLLLAVSGLYIGWLSLAAISVGLIGREYINFKHRMADRNDAAYFQKPNRGIKVLGIIPGSPAERLGILIGETILKVNGNNVNHKDQFYQALQNSAAFVKLELKDDNGESRIVQSALYDTDHHELGILTSGTRRRQKQQMLGTNS